MKAHFDWGAQGRLIFNRSFSGTTAAFYSYSVALRPDFTFIPGPGFASGTTDRHLRRQIPVREQDVEHRR